ncbi:MAG: hydroxysqualene dehydroxylase HpnE [Parvularculaceae bacterium]
MRIQMKPVQKLHSAGCVHVVGAGLAGLAAAVRLSAAGRPVTVYDSAPRAGGRCRSFHDERLGRLIDNGNHLMMSGNRSVLSYAAEIGATDPFMPIEAAVFPFVDLKTGERWAIRMDDGPIPFWMFSASRRAPNTGITDYLGALRVALAGPNRRVSEVIKTDGAIYERFWEPLTIAALNASPQDGAAKLLWAVLRETFLRGGAACRPLIAREGLGPALIDPAIATLRSRGADIRFGARLREIAFAEGEAAALDFGDETVDLGPYDVVLLAVPPSRAAKLLPDFAAPGERGVILNAHFVLEERIESAYAPFIGLLNSTAHWIFVRDNMASITISAADGLNEERDASLIPVLWEETRKALDLATENYAAARIIREKRATFDQRPESVARRPATRTRWRNLFLAGDWVDTGLPATIESAVRSGHMAAEAVAKAQV